MTLALVILLLAFAPAGWAASTLRSGSAYLDPGSGSFILQLIIATLLGGLFIVKAFWQRILGFFRKLFSRDGGDRQE